MAKLSHILESDPTLQAADRALEAEAAASPYRTQTIAMGQIGGSCSAKAWHNFRWTYRERFDHVALKRFDDGHRGEDVVIERLRKVPGIEVESRDPKTGKQFTYIDCDGHSKGKCDGKIRGLLQAPKKLHILEVKIVSEKKLAEFRKIKYEVGEKSTLKKWNQEYYGQGQLYMHYEPTDRHYTVVASAGCRDWDSCRTEYDAAYALKLVHKARQVRGADAPLERVSNKPDWYECKMCAARFVCHEGFMPDRNCRTCVHSTPIDNAQWHCDRWGKPLTADEQQTGCPAHKFLPGLVPGEVIGTTETSITYRMRDGTEWTDSEETHA